MKIHLSMSVAQVVCDRWIGGVIIHMAVVEQTSVSSGEDECKRVAELGQELCGRGLKRTVDKRQVRWDYAQSTPTSRPSVPPSADNAAQHAPLPGS